MLSKKVLQYPTSTILMEIDQNVSAAEMTGVNLWGANKRHELNQLHEQTRSISLMVWTAPQGAPIEERMKTHAQLNYPHKWPEINSFMHLFEQRMQCSVKIINIVKLPPNGVVHPHIDGDAFYDIHDRWHLVLKGTYDMIVDDEHFTYEPGGVYWFDNNKMHSVENGDEERICIIFDTLPYA